VVVKVERNTSTPVPNGKKYLSNGKQQEEETPFLISLLLLTNSQSNGIYADLKQISPIFTTFDLEAIII